MKFEGAMTALVTPMKADGAIDFGALERLVESQIAAGIHGLVAMGTTGESATMMGGEHVEVVRAVVAATKGRVPVVAGAGANSTAKAIELSKACAEAGANALLHVSGYYNKPSQEGLYRHFVACADATSCPVILYNVPGRTIVDLENDTVARLAEHDRIVAIKDATGDMRRASQLIARVGDQLSILSGDDFTTFSLMALGGDGVVSVVSNAMPAQMAQLCDAAKAGDWQRSRQLHFELMRLTELLFVEANPVPIKYAMALGGQIEAHVRLPLVEVTPSLAAELKTWTGE